MKDRYRRRAVPHFDEYFRLLQKERIDMIYLDCYLDLLYHADRVDTARLFLETLIKRLPLFIALKECLLSHLLQYYPSDRLSIRDLIFDIFKTCSQVGASVKIFDAICSYLKAELCSKNLQRGEYGRYLLLHSFGLRLKLSWSKSRIDRDRLEKSLEACHIQFQNSEMISLWNILLQHFP